MVRRDRLRARWVAVMASVTLVGVIVASSGPSSADVTAVRGSAFGYQANVALFGSQQPQTGPTPIVTLPPGGSATPLTATEPTGLARAGPAVFFTSGEITVSTQGTTGPTGTVTSRATINNITNASGGQLVATRLESTCTATEAGRSGTTTITGGTLETDSGDDVAGDPIPDHPPVVVNLPVNPAPNTTFEGHIHVNGATDNFQVILNEQIANPDGSLTINAYHVRLLGPTATGDLIVGQVTCGVTATQVTTTTTTTQQPTTTQLPTTTSTTMGGGTTTTTLLPGGGGFCAQLQQLRAQFNAEINRLAVTIAGLGPFAQPFLATLEQVRAQGLASIDRALASVGCTV